MRHDHILDQDRPEENTRAGQKSFFLFLASLATYSVPIGLVLTFGSEAPSNDAISTAIGLSVLIGYVLCVIGFRRGVQAVRRNERRNYQLVIGLAGNAILVMLMLGMILLNVLDYTRMISLDG
ncbi:MAG: hypothetical protein AAFU60_11790 [Bacteroidota bacterium]